MRALALSCAVSLAATLHAQPSSSGTELWVTFMENLDLAFNTPPYFELVISSDVNTSGEVQVPQTGFAIPFTVDALHDTVITLPNNIYYPQGDEDVFDFGLRVVANDPVSVYAYHHRQYFSEASMALPVEQLGTDHLVMAHLDVSQTSPSELVVMATQDATDIEITPSVVTVSFRPPGQPFVITLDQGQVFQLQAYGDLTGTRVRSLDESKPIALFAGARQARVGCGDGADDHLYQSIPPLSEWGDRFVVVPFKYRGGDPFRLLSASDGTQVVVGTAPAITLNSGQYVDQVLTTPTTITASAPIAVGQFNESQNCNPQPGDPCFLWNFPTSERDRRFIWSARTGAGTPDHYVNAVVSGAAAAPPVFLDDVNITPSFLPVPNTTGYYYAQVPVSAGEHRLECATGIWATAYGFGDYNSYSFALGYEDLSTAVQDIAPIPTAQPAYLAASGDPLPLPLRNATIVELFDATGRSVARLDAGNTTVWPTLPEGLYVWSLFDRTGAVQRGRVLISGH